MCATDVRHPEHVWLTTCAYICLYASVETLTHSWGQCSLVVCWVKPVSTVWLFIVYTYPDFSELCCQDQYPPKKPVPWKCMHSSCFSDKKIKVEVLHHTLVDINPVILRFPTLFCYSVICSWNSTHWGHCVSAMLNESLHGDETIWEVVQSLLTFPFWTQCLFAIIVKGLNESGVICQLFLIPLLTLLKYFCSKLLNRGGRVRLSFLTWSRIPVCLHSTCTHTL